MDNLELPGVGDTVTVTVSKPLPFGALCRTPGGATALVTNLRHATEGDSVTVTVGAVDSERQRFSGMAI